VKSTKFNVGGRFAVPWSRQSGNRIADVHDRPQDFPAQGVDPRPAAWAGKRPAERAAAMMRWYSPIGVVS
jgi:hypothetical protein